MRIQNKKERKKILLMLRLLLRLQKICSDEKEVENKLYSIKDNEEKEDNNLKGEIKNTIDITEFYEQSKYPSLWI